MHLRNQHVIFNTDTKVRTVYESRNKAKKASHAIQMKANSNLGRGELRIGAEPKT